MKKMTKQSLIVFDMDGVLIDVSNSYRDTVRQTAGLFFSPAQHAKLLPAPLFDLSDLAAVKQSGGLNNDWDLSCLTISLLFTQTENMPIDESDDPWSAYRKVLSGCDVSRLAEYLKSEKKSLQKLFNQYGKRIDPFISQIYQGDVGTGNIIKQIFQEIYLGQELFRSTYQRNPEMYHGEGYILREKVLVGRPLLDKLSENYLLAIATGRPKAEAYYPLENFKLLEYFREIYTLDECIEEEQHILKENGKEVSLSKPHPFMLDAIADTIGGVVDGYYYVGDMPDDMLAAKRSRTGFKAIGILMSSPDKENLKKNLVQAGADYIIDDFAELIRLVETGKR
jgi:phosphoglycolate phosphatase-like HAD superfamily hydrolase